MSKPANNHSLELAETVRGWAGNLLQDSVAAHKRRCAIRQGVCEADTCNCQHDWDITKCWCRTCGLTKFDLVEKEVGGC